MSKYYTFTEIQKMMTESNELFVRNTTKIGGNESMYVVTYVSGDGQHHGFNLPRTPIAFNILDHLDGSWLVNSTDFRRAINAGHIEVVDSAEAKKALEDPDIRENLQIALQEADLQGIKTLRASEKQKFEAAQAAERNKSQNNEISQMFGGGNAQNLNTHVPEPKTTSRLAALESRVASIPPEEALRTLKSMYATLKLDDLQTVAASDRFPEESRQWAREKLKKQLEDMTKAQ